MRLDVTKWYSSDIYEVWANKLEAMTLHLFSRQFRVGQRGSRCNKIGLHSDSHQMK